MPTIRPATREDIKQFSDIPQKPTMKAWVAEHDGEMIGIGGFARVNARWFAFCDLTDEARQYKITIMRTAKMVMEEARKNNIKIVYTVMDTTEKNSKAWLKSLGFELDSRSQFLYKWTRNN